MDFTAIITFLGASILLTLMPGPDNLFVLAQSMSKGKYAGISTACGLCTGLIVHIAAAAGGISAVIYQSALAFAFVKYAGAAYLLFLAYKSFREKSSGFDLGDQPALSCTLLYQKGVIMNLLNPKVSLFFLAFLPQFVDDGAGQAAKQMLIYGMLFLIQALAIFIIISIFAEKVGNVLRKSSAISQKIHLIQGYLFALIGLKIALSQK
ncbi:LysE family translocator [Bacillus swezeyi]|uniref:Threonine transporter RhtB n=1 Tax=Bacillus swezeyi TaxID=1925020 RepID=A0A1R1RFD5_9BACI|nr:LysE family translocator [Bacillus swezeyi]MEC1261866.1 LysE family translocator [Bacillus swezeyi]MED2930255.1 LysE family translocator [Bacillus swezeyi]MED2945063.1 LysE family translocator [Bacillus swezeyi]MED2966166.1 LysE family translocator [Bacillus swezeyi]MED2976844.1 LysE family translocator [Bacillus swezeyi]